MLQYHMRQVLCPCILAETSSPLTAATRSGVVLQDLPQDYAGITPILLDDLFVSLAGRPFLLCRGARHDRRYGASRGAGDVRARSHLHSELEPILRWSTCQHWPCRRSPCPPHETLCIAPQVLNDGVHPGRQRADPHRLWWSLHAQRLLGKDLL